MGVFEIDSCIVPVNQPFISLLRKVVKKISKIVIDIPVCLA